MVEEVGMAATGLEEEPGEATTVMDGVHACDAVRV